MSEIIFKNTEQDLKDLNLTIEDVNKMRAKLNNVAVIIENVGISRNGKIEKFN